MVDCTDCIYFEVDDFDVDNFFKCNKGYDILLSLEIPSNCNNFELYICKR